MRIAYFSDVHTEILRSQTRLLGRRWTDDYPLNLGPRLTGLLDQVDIVILAGDIGTGRVASGISATLYAEQVAKFLGVPVVLVPGNHEYYGFVFEDTRDDLLATDLPNVHVMDRSLATFDIDGRSLRVLGATLWTDYALTGDQREGKTAALNYLNDHRRILTNRGTRWMPEDALQEHEESRRWLLDKLKEPHEGPTVVVTHHLPHSAGNNPQFPIDAMGASFMSDCDDLIEAAKEANVAGWIFGHNHYNVVVEERGVKLMTAQPGYPRERTGWQGPGILEI